MAVDTANKRYSAMQLGGATRMLPVPDGTVDASDRLHFLRLYSGIAAATASAGVLKVRLNDGTWGIIGVT